jgi:hypothetical protein
MKRPTVHSFRSPDSSSLSRTNIFLITLLSLEPEAKKLMQSFGSWPLRRPKRGYEGIAY